MKHNSIKRLDPHVYELIACYEKPMFVFCKTKNCLFSEKSFQFRGEQCRCVACRTLQASFSSLNFCTRVVEVPSLKVFYFPCKVNTFYSIKPGAVAMKMRNLHLLIQGRQDFKQIAGEKEKKKNQKI